MNSNAYGMGEPLYAQVVGKIADGKLGRPCRIYAPVGTHETLLAYLVRRLLENGANTSFVNRIADTTISLDELVADPVKGSIKLRKLKDKSDFHILKSRSQCSFMVMSVKFTGD